MEVPELGFQNPRVLFRNIVGKGIRVFAADTLMDTQKFQNIGRCGMHTDEFPVFFW